MTTTMTTKNGQAMSIPEKNHPAAKRFLCQPIHRALLISALLVWAICACSSDSPRGVLDSVSGDGVTLYSTPDSPLVLSVPEALVLSQSRIDTIYAAARTIPHLYYTAGDPVDIVLAETAINYHAHYLYPDNLPLSLDGIPDAAAYVAFISENDPYTYYYSAADVDYLNSFYQGDRSYIGFRYDSEEDSPWVTVEEVYPFTRAWFDGLLAGDRIVAVDGQTLEGTPLESVTDLFPKAEGETVQLTVQRDSTEINITTAAEEHIGFLLDADTAYLSVRAFTMTTGTEVQKDFEALTQTAGGTVSKLILDLRGNPGGKLYGARMLADYFIDNDTPPQTNPILFLEDIFQEIREYYLGSNPENIAGFGADTAVLLIDANSASSSEVTAAALKHYGAATLMGSQSFGKGIAQTPFVLVDGSLVMIPAYYIQTPAGERYHDIGIAPDIVLPASPVAADNDPLLDAARQFLETGSVAEMAAVRTTASTSGAVSQRHDPLRDHLVRRQNNSL
jgi:carboxyl-terminal processing protease